jgi:branched-chain amino acid aminotransferase
VAWYSQTWNWFDGAWHEGNPPLIGPRSHVAWLGSSVFDGARVFEGVMPDMDMHCARVNRSARTIGLEPTMAADAILELVREGVKKFAPNTALYVKPMYWGEAEGLATISPDPASTRFCLSLFEAPMPVPGGLSVMKSSFRRPTLESMPTDSKAGCLYPNNARVLREAKENGFDNALVCDALGNVAETGTSNVFMAKDGAVHTPAPNGTFLNGITRQRVVGLLRDAGVEVIERTIRVSELLDADEIFSTGNHGKVVPCLKYEEKSYAAGPLAAQARELYWAFAHGPAAIKPSRETVSAR